MANGIPQEFRNWLKEKYPDFWQIILPGIEMGDWKNHPLYKEWLSFSQAEASNQERLSKLGVNTSKKDTVAYTVPKSNTNVSGNAKDPNAGKELVIAPDMPMAWEQLGMSEEEFAYTYPDLYKQVTEFMTAANNQTPGTFTEVWGDFSDEQLQTMADRLGISVEELKSQLTASALGLSYTSEEEKKQAQQQWADQMSLEWSKIQADKWAADTAIANQITAGIWSDIAGYNRANSNMLENEAYPLIGSNALNRQFEQMRNDILGSLAPTDWVSKWLVNSKANPYQTPNDLEFDKELVKKYENDTKFFQDQLKSLQDRINDPSNPLVYNQAVKDQEDFLKRQVQSLQDLKTNYEAGYSLDPNSWVKRIMDATGANYSDALNLITQYKSTNGEGDWMISDEVKDMLTRAGWEMFPQEAARQVPSLGIPDWLSPMIEGSPTSVRYGSKLPQGITPSGQQWGRFTQTQKDLWANYVQSSGGRVEDLLGQAQMQLPKSLSLGKTWASF